MTKKTISSRNKQVIEKAKQEGHVVVIATGRPYRASLQYYQELNLQTAIVNFNGAFVHHPHDRQFGTYHEPLELATAKTIIETCEAFRVSNIMAEIIDEFYLRHLDEVFIETFTPGQQPLAYGNLHTLIKSDPTSLLIYPHAHQADELYDVLKDAHAEVIEQRSWGAPWHIIEIVKSGLNKAVA